MADQEFDVVIVGAGVAGALAANALTQKGLRVVVLEAGPPFGDIDQHVKKFYYADAKSPDAPWPGKAPSDDAKDEFAPRPTVLDMGRENDLVIDGNVAQHNFKWSGWYMQQTGDYPFNSTYERVAGGTSNHWLGTCLRHVPNDFRLRSHYGANAANSPEGQELKQYARDWPITYDDLEPWYLRAEQVVGVAGDSQGYADYLGAKRSAPYPMDEIPASYLDQRLGARLDGMEVAEVTGAEIKIKVMSTPQGRNSRDYGTAADAKEFGLYGEGRFPRYRCLGNTSCIPVCPIGAKWDANVALREAVSGLTEPSFPDKTAADVRYRAVAYKVVVGEDDKVAKILYKDYTDANQVKDGSVTGKIYILAAHAVETPKLLLMSEWKQENGKNVTVANSSDQVGRNIMDHVIHLSWALADEPLYPFRGPLSTAGIGDFRDSDARTARAAYRIEIGNDGWVWPALAPQKTVWQIMNIDNTEEWKPKENRTETDKADVGIDLIRAFYRRPGAPPRPKWYGKELRRAVNEVVTRQIRMAAEPEALPLPDSRVTLADRSQPQSVDKLNLPKPSIHYVISEYTKKGFVEGARTFETVFAKLGVPSADEIATVIVGQGAAAVFSYPPNGSSEEPKNYEYGGAGHIAGTYRMGDDATDSVVDKDCRSHDHANLFLLGSGVFPSLGTANPTLTIMALALRAADTIASELGHAG